MAKRNVTHKPLKPKRLAGFTQKARGATFAQLTTGLGTGQHAKTAVSYYPFVGPDAGKWFARTHNLDTQARGYVARSLRERDIRAKITGNTGTIPELVVVGYYLSQGYRLHRTLFFQEVALTGFRLTRKFIADVAVSGPGGMLILLPIDGRFFHDRTLSQQLDAQRRNAALSRLGRVVPIPDIECFSGVRLRSYLRRKGVAA
jgi:hypothetical protein